jgi:hypothetical protein
VGYIHLSVVIEMKMGFCANSERVLEAAMRMPRSIAMQIAVPCTRFRVFSSPRRMHGCRVLFSDFS